MPAPISRVLGNRIAYIVIVASISHPQGIPAASIVAADSISRTPLETGIRRTASTAPMDNNKAAAATAAALIAVRDSFRVRTRVAGPAATRALRASTKAAMGAVVAPLVPEASTKAALGAAAAEPPACHPVRHPVRHPIRPPASRPGHRPRPLRNLPSLTRLDSLTRGRRARPPGTGDGRFTDCYSHQRGQKRETRRYA